MNTSSQIPLDVLKNVKTIVTHAHCPDGLASAMLLHDVLPKAEILFLTHDQLDSLEAKEGMLFCDIAPSRERVLEFIQVNAVVLDHHKSARDVVLKFGAEKHQLSCEEGARCSCTPGLLPGYGVYADEACEPGVSGAVLAFREVWCPLMKAFDVKQFEQQAPEAEYLATLVGVRDTFHKSSEWWDKAWDLSAALMFRPVAEWLATPYPFRPHFWAEQLEFGALINANNRERATRASKEAFKFTTAKDVTVSIVQGLSLTTLLGDMGLADLIVGFAYRCDVHTGEPRFQVSMRSQGVVDVKKIAETYGGGGHTNAAGFTLNSLPAENPILWLEEMIAHAEV